MEIIVNLMLTCTVIVLTMFAVDILANFFEIEELKELTENQNYHLVGGSFIVLTFIFAFISVLMLIWS